MIEKLRSNDDADYGNQLHETLPYRTEPDQKEVRCSVCGSLYFVDEQTYANLVRAMKHDLDNQFLCDECERSYQDAAFE